MIDLVERTALKTLYLVSCTLYRTCVPPDVSEYLHPGQQVIWVAATPPNDSRLDIVFSPAF